MRRVEHETTPRLIRRGGGGRRLSRISMLQFSLWVFLFASIFLLYFLFFGFVMLSPGEIEESDDKSLSQEAMVAVGLNVSVKESPSVGLNVSVKESPSVDRSKHRRRKYVPCEIGLKESVNYFKEPREVMNFTQFDLEYVDQEERLSSKGVYEPSFGGRPTLEERERSFHAVNQTLHCGFFRGSEASNAGFDIDAKDKAYMNSCKVTVSSCIFGSSDFLRRPASKKVSDFSKKNVCFVMFSDEETLAKVIKEGHVPDDTGRIGLWKIVVVKNVPYADMCRTGKVPTLLSHRLFPSSRYSIWVDSKLRFNAVPMQIIEHFLWQAKSEFAISNHYDRHCVWEEVLQNKRLNKYNHTVIDEQFRFYQSDGLIKFDSSDPNTPLPSYVPEGSFIIRAHTPMSNLFSCLWFNEVDRFTSCDQLSFAYSFLKLRRMNPDRPFYLNMFKDCECRVLTKLFRHRRDLTTPPVD